MEMREEWLSALRVWAAAAGSVRELWLVGSRATDKARPESDVGLVIALMPAKGTQDWALGNYFALADPLWQRQLEDIVGRHVCLEAIEPRTDKDAKVRREGVLLWARPGL